MVKCVLAKLLLGWVLSWQVSGPGCYKRREMLAFDICIYGWIILLKSVNFNMANGEDVLVCHLWAPFPNRIIKHCMNYEVWTAQQSFGVGENAYIRDLFGEVSLLVEISQNLFLIHVVMSLLKITKKGRMISVTNWVVYKMAERSELLVYQSEGMKSQSLINTWSLVTARTEEW